MEIDGLPAIVHCDGDGYVIVSYDYMFALTRGGAWSRNPFNAYRHNNRDEANAAIVEVSTRDIRKSLRPDDKPLFQMNRRD